MLSRFARHAERRFGFTSRSRSVTAAPAVGFGCWNRTMPQPCLAAMHAMQGCQRWGLPGGAGDIGGDDAGGVPVQAAAGPVVAHRSSRVRVRGGFLDVTERDPGIERGGNECMSERVRAHFLGDPRLASDPTDDPPGTM